MKKIFLFLLGFLVASSSFLKASQIIIMRHGQAQHNVDNFRSSNPNHPRYKASYLTKLGKSEVLRTAKNLKQRHFAVGRVYASPLPRTQETARIVMKELGIHHSKLNFDIRLTERQAGDLEGTRISYAQRGVSGVETRKQIKNRVLSLYRDLNPKENILVVTHGGPAKLLSQIISGKATSLKTGNYVLVHLKDKKSAKRIAKNKRGVVKRNEKTLAIVKELKNKKRASHR